MKVPFPKISIRSMCRVGFGRSLPCSQGFTHAPADVTVLTAMPGTAPSKTVLSSTEMA
jgi:hypothetical protein